MQSNRDNKKIARNAIFLYIRMGITMLLGFYTSRVVLQALGEVDFGIHNVVAGVVLMLAFFNATSVASVQRYLNMALGEKSLSYARDVFTAAVRIHLIISGFIFVLAETIGLWFLNSKLNIPADRMFAANMVYQFSVISFMFTINQSPLQAVVISKEHMNVYALISVVDVVLKFLLAFYLLVAKFDRLLLYGLLLALVSMIDYLFYWFYCFKKYEECQKGSNSINREVFRSLLGFSGWALIGSLAFSLFNQGVNILLNIYAGPAVNAARGLSMTVNTGIYAFVYNFSIAFDPQLIKTYASKEYDSLSDLLFKSVKFSWVLYSIIALPILFEMDFVLGVWLKDVPLYTAIFCQIILADSFLLCAERPLVVVCNGIGCVKQANLTIGITYCVTFVIAWQLLKYTGIVISPLLVHLVIAFFAVSFYIFLIWRYIRINALGFFKVVVVRYFASMIIPLAMLFLIRHYMEDGWLRLFVTIITSTLTIITMVYFVGLDNHERTTIKVLIQNKLPYVGKN